jgi:hypothetical protein
LLSTFLPQHRKLRHRPEKPATRRCADSESTKSAIHPDAGPQATVRCGVKKPAPFICAFRLTHLPPIIGRITHHVTMSKNNGLQ